MGKLRVTIYIYYLAASESNVSTNSTPTTTQAPPMTNPLAGLGGMPNMGGQSFDPSMIQNFMNNPAMMQMMSSMMSNPEMMRNMMSNNPALQNMGVDPDTMAAMFSNPEMIQNVMGNMGGAGILLILEIL